jgi:hypothetical protein
MTGVLKAADLFGGSIVPARHLRDGVDVRQPAPAAAHLVLATQLLPWAASQYCADYCLTAMFVGIPAGWWTGRKIDALIAPEGVNVITYARVEDNAGKIKVSIVEFNVVPATEIVQTSATSTMTTPTSGNIELTVSCLVQRVEVTLNGTVVFDRMIARCAGTFRPMLLCNLTTSATLQCHANWALASGERTRDVTEPQCLDLVPHPFWLRGFLGQGGGTVELDAASPGGWASTL